MIPKPQKPDRPAYTPTRADTSVITAGMRGPRMGESLITNNVTGMMQQRAQTGRTITTGGTRG